MDGNKYDVSNAKSDEPSPASIKPLSDEQKEGEAEKMLENAESKVALGTPNSDSCDVKYTEKNGDAKLDIGELKAAFVGMGKEELMKYANDPFWIRLRWFLFITFWLLWAGMLVGAIMIIYAAPKCVAPEPKSWWEQGPLSEIEDTATTLELEELKHKGVQGVIVKWPYDAYTFSVNDSVNFVDLLRKAKEIEMSIIVELKPGTSNLWLDKSENNSTGYEDFYIWAKSRNSDENSPPNNWLRRDNQSSWIYSTKRKEYYYSRDGEGHLNFRNGKVVEEFSNVIRAFLDAGVKGVSLVNIPTLLVDQSLTDEEPRNDVPGLLHTDYDFYSHTKTENLPDLGGVLNTWRKIVKSKTENGPFFLHKDLTTLEPYKVDNSLVVDLPRQSQILNRNDLGAFEILNGLNATFRFLNTTWPLWRHSTEALPGDVLDAITFMLPGVPLISKQADVSKDLLNIRITAPSVMNGNFNYYSVANSSVFAFIRASAGNPSILVAVNPTDGEIKVNFPREIPVVSDEVTVKFISGNYIASNVELKMKKSAYDIPISAKAAVVLSYVPKG